MWGSGRRVVGFGNGLSDRNAFDPRDRNDVSQLRSVMSVRFSPENENNFVILVLCSVPSSLAIATSSPVCIFSIEDARDRQSPQIIAVVEIGYEDLQRTGCIPLGRRNCF